MPRNNNDFHESRTPQNYFRERDYSTVELAKALSVDRKTVNRWVRAGKFEKTRQTLGGTQRPGRHRITTSQAAIDYHLGLTPPDFSAEKPKKPRKPKSA